MANTKTAALSVAAALLAALLVPALVNPLTAEPATLSETVGLVDPSQGQWHLRNSLGAVTSFFFGNPGDFPIACDWDCDGVDTPGMYRQSDGFVYLSNANTSQRLKPR